MSDTPETDALAQLEAEWRERARQQRVLIARGQCLNPAALGGMADANEARADDLAALRRALRDDQTRSVEPVNAPAPQHAAENERTRE